MSKFGFVGLKDENGVAYGVKHIGNKPRVSNTPYYVDIAEGNIAAHDALRKFGHNSAVGAAKEPVWDGSAVYSYLTAAEQLQIVSSDVDDQGDDLTSGTSTTLTGGSTTTIVDTGADFVTDGVAAGDIFINDTNKEHAFVKTITDLNNIILELATATSNDSGDSYRIVNANDTGAAVVHIQGLDGSYASLTEYIVLNGQTDVTTVGSYLRIFRMKVLLAGATGANEGTISAEDNASSVLLAQISIGMAQTLMALWTVPAGKTAYLTSFYASTSSSKATEIYLCIRPLGEVFQIKKLVTIYEGSTILPYDFPLQITQKSDISIDASAGGGGGEVSAGFDLWYE